MQSPKGSFHSRENAAWQIYWFARWLQLESLQDHACSQRLQLKAASDLLSSHYAYGQHQTSTQITITVGQFR